MVQPRLGFGVSGAHGTPLISRKATRALIEAARAGGIALFDTAPAYGAGEAERRLGLALAGTARGDLLVSTKAGVHSAGLSKRVRDFSPAGIERSLRASIERLGVEGVDYLFLHGPAPQELCAPLFERLEALKASGGFARLGVAGRGRELDAALETGAFAALMQPVYPGLDLAGEARIAAAQSAGLEVFAIETSGPGRAPLTLPRRPADLYRFAKTASAALARAPLQPRVPVEDGLAAALKRTDLDYVLTTTTRPEHLRRTLALAARDRA